RELWKMVYELVESGIGVVWSTAYLDEAERCSDVLLLNEGKLLYHGPPRELTQQLEGRTFLITGNAERRRSVLHRAIERSEVIDGVIQGSSVRLLLAPGAQPPRGDDLGDPEAIAQPTPPRFEDAFIHLLGRRPPTESRSADARVPAANVGAVTVESDG